MVDHLTEEQILEFKQNFNVFVRGTDGTIPHAQLGNVMRTIGQNFTEPEIDAMMKEVDVDQSGTLDVDEFLYLMTLRMKDPDTEEDIKEGYHTWKPAGSKSVTAIDLKNVMAGLGEEFNDDDIEELMHAADQDGDWLISYEDFKAL